VLIIIRVRKPLIKRLHAKILALVQNQEGTRANRKPLMKRLHAKILGLVVQNQEGTRANRKQVAKQRMNLGH
jgi:hypothetical protein